MCNTHHLVRAIRRQREEERALAQAGVLNGGQPLELEDLARQVAFLAAMGQPAR